LTGNVCKDTGWVCENSPAKPWDGACGCGAAAPLQGIVSLFRE
jgi:hypothetical protein